MKLHSRYFGRVQRGTTSRMSVTTPLRRSTLRLARGPRLSLEHQPLAFPAIHGYFHARALQAIGRTRTIHGSVLRRNASDDKGHRCTAEDCLRPSPKSTAPPPPLPSKPSPATGKHPGHAQDYIPLIRRLLPHLQTPHNPLHRPTKEELLAAATSFWQRLRIRFKWFSIRGWRRFNADDLSAFLSWFLVGNSKFIDMLEETVH
jgi:distribution and morphology protein 31